MYSTMRSRMGRKRQSSESSAEASKAKRKKLRAKDPPLLATHAQSPPPEAPATSMEAVVPAKTAARSIFGAKDPPLLASHAQFPPSETPPPDALPPEAVVPAKTAARSKKGGRSSKLSKTAKVARESEHPSGVQEPSPTATASTSAEAPKAKRKKLRAKDPPLLASHAQSPPPEAPPPKAPPPEAPAASTEAVVPAKTAARSKKGGSTSKLGKAAKVAMEPEHPSGVQEPSPTATASTTTEKKPIPKRHAKPKNYYFKPQNKSWMSHIAAVVVYRCVSEAMRSSFDPRAHLSDINWTLMAEKLFSAEDMKKVWYYIGKEFPDAPLNEISVNLQPYADLSMNQLVREDIRLKYKDQMPKPPVSAYLLFSMSKAPKLKEKHPELSQTEMAVKLGKRWKSIGAEKQEKYKQQYAALRRNYEEEVEQFYQDHPDARPPPHVSKRKAREKAVLSPEEKRFQEVKAAMPKLPVSGYLLFCKAKREKLHRKYPELSPAQVTVKLGKKWQAMGDEGRAKYKKVYEESSQIYKQQLEEFYAQNPGAKEILQMRKKKKKRTPKTSLPQTSVWTQTQLSPLSPEELHESPLPTIREEGEEEEEEGSGLEEHLSEGHSQERNEASSESDEDSDSSDSEDE